MRQSEYGLLRPGTRVLIGDQLLGNTLYGIGNPVEYQRFLGSTGTVVKCERDNRRAIVTVAFDGEAEKKLFLIEEIDSIVDDDCENSDDEIVESSESLSSLFG